MDPASETSPSPRKPSTTRPTTTESTTTTSNSSASSSSTTTSSSSSSCPLPRLLRCFCNCSELTYDEVRTIAQLNVDQTLGHPQALRLLKAYLRLGTTTVRNICLRHVEHAELCATVIAEVANGCSAVPDKYIDELFDSCASLDWERRLEAALESELPDAVAEYCAEVRVGAVACIADDAKWTGFKEELRRKLGH